MSCARTWAKPWVVLINTTPIKVGISLKFWKKNIEVWFFTKFECQDKKNIYILTISVAISLKLVFSKRIIFAVEKHKLRRIWPIQLKFSGFVVLSRFCRMNINFSMHCNFVQVMGWNVCWIFCIRFNWSSSHVFITFPKSLCLSQ